MARQSKGLAKGLAKKLADVQRGKRPAARRAQPRSSVADIMAPDDADASRMLELYYWAREPGLVELMRAYLAAPEPTQRALSDFFVSKQPESIVSSTDGQGRLVLSRP